MATSAVTALVVTLFTSFVILFPEYYKLWATIAFFSAVFAFMLLRNPAYRYMRLAWWIAAAWGTAAAVPEINATVQIKDVAAGTFGFGNQPSWAFHIACAFIILGCIVLDYFMSRGNSVLRLIFHHIHVRFGGQYQTVTGGTAIQVGDISGKATVNIQQTDVNRELDHAKALLERGKPDAAEEHILRIKRDFEPSLTVQQQFRMEAYLGKVFHDRGEAPKSAVHYLNAYRLRPNDEEGRAYGVFSEFIAGKSQVAYAKATELLQEHPESILATAVMIRSAPPEVDASTLVTRVHGSVKDEVDVMAALATRFLLQHDAATAEDYSRRSLAKRPDHPALVGRVGTAIVIGEADTVGKRCWEGPLNDGTRHRLNEAISLLTTALTISTAPGEVRHFRCMRGLAREVLGKLTEAEADYVAAVESDPIDHEAVIRYISFLGRKERYNEALKVLRVACAKDVSIELSLKFANLALGTGTDEDKRSAILCLRRGIGKLSEKLPQQRDDAFWFLSELTCETAGPVAALAIRTEFSTLPLTDTVRAMAETSRNIKAGDIATANETASRAINALRDDAPLQFRLQLTHLLEKLRRFSDIVAVLSPIASVENFKFAGTVALNAAHRCGADEFIINYSRSLREAGRWDATVVELEIGTLQKYHDYDRAISVCLEYIERAPDERERRLTRLRLSLVGLQSGQHDLIQRNAELLPNIEEVDARNGRILCGVLKHTATPIRAVEIAYELVRRYYTNHEAHIALCAATGIGQSEKILVPEPEAIAAGTAVRISIDGETPRWLVIEDGPYPDPARQEYAPTHTLCVELIGRKKGDRFVDRSNPYQEKYGVIEEVMNKFMYRAMDSLTRWTDLFPNELFALTFNIKSKDGELPDFTPILRTFEAQSQNELSLRKWYQDNPVSILMMSIALKRHPTQVIQYLGSHPDMPIRCCRGTLEAYEDGRSIAASAMLVADPSALSTLYVTNLWQGMSNFPFKLVVTVSSIDEFLRLAEEHKHSSGMRLAAHEGELIPLTISPEVSQNLALTYERFVAWVRSVAEVRAGIVLATIPQNRRDELISLFGQSAAESIAISTHEQLPLWTDDENVPVAIYQGKRVLRTWTQLVAERLRAEGCISDDQFAGLLAQLIELGYQDTQCTPEALLKAAQQSDWNPDVRPLRAILNWLGNGNITEDGVLGVTVGGLRLIWRTAALVHQREGVTYSIGRVLSGRPGGKILVQRIAASTTQLFPLEPHYAEDCRDILLRSLDDIDGNRLILP